MSRKLKKKERIIYMLTEDFCSFEVAWLLKEKGFDEPCYRWYDNKGIVCAKFINPDIPPDYSSREYYLCPSQSMAMKWLREVHGLHISLEPCYDYDSMHVEFLAFVQNVADVHEFMDGRKNVASHPNAEKSCEAAIKYCLENLI